MRHSGLRSIPREKTRKNTIGVDAETPRPADKVNRQFVAAAPNQLWVADLTTSAPAAAGSTPGSSSRCSPAGSWTGRSRPVWAPISPWTPSTWACGAADGGPGRTPAAHHSDRGPISRRSLHRTACRGRGGGLGRQLRRDGPGAELTVQGRAHPQRLRGTGCTGIDDVQSRRWRTTDHADGRGTLSHGDHLPVDLPRPGRNPDDPTQHRNAKRFRDGPTPLIAASMRRAIDEGPRSAQTDPRAPLSIRRARRVTNQALPAGRRRLPAGAIRRRRRSQGVPPRPGRRRDHGLPPEPVMPNPRSVGSVGGVAPSCRVWPWVNICGAQSLSFARGW